MWFISNKLIQLLYRDEDDDDDDDDDDGDDDDDDDDDQWKQSRQVR